MFIFADMNYIWYENRYTASLQLLLSQTLSSSTNEKNTWNEWLFVAVHAIKSLWLHLTLCDPMDYSQVPLPMGFPRQEFWSGMPCPPPWDLPDSEIKSSLLHSQVGSLPLVPPGKHKWRLLGPKCCFYIKMPLSLWGWGSSSGQDLSNPEFLSSY